MAKEHDQPAEQRHILLTGIYLDIPSKTVVFAAEDKVIASLRLAPEGLIFDVTHHPVSALPHEPGVAIMTPPASVSRPEQTETEKPKTLTLTGKLKSKPREGRPDSKGNPTAWARLAVHEEEREGAHLYSATFHKHTAQIALTLDKDIPVTVQGYPHENDDPGSRRMDTLSVINFLDYPGKPQK